MIEMELPAPEPTVSDVFQQLSRLYPDVERFRPSLLVAVNQEYSPWNGAVSDGDEVAFFPPVSGGST